MTDKDVERAYVEQFDRLEHMMFTRVVVTGDSGKTRRTEAVGSLPNAMTVSTEHGVMP